MKISIELQSLEKQMLVRMPGKLRGIPTEKSGDMFVADPEVGPP